MIHTSLLSFIAYQESKKGLGTSLNAFMKKIDGHGLQSDVTVIIKNYWNQSGKIIRGYRNINDHHISLIQNSFFNYDSESQKFNLIVPLPDNADNEDTKSNKKRTYINQINAIEFIQSEFKILVKFLENLSRAYGYKKSDLKYGYTSRNLLHEKEATFIQDLEKDQITPNGVILNYTVNNEIQAIVVAQYHNAKMVDKQFTFQYQQ